jgi:ABC-type dipeptide/oligopeptide/nickel transport system permease subunit
MADRLLRVLRATGTRTRLTVAIAAIVVAALVGAFLGTAMGKFLLANDCGLVSAWRLQDSGLDTGVEPA